MMSFCYRMATTEQVKSIGERLNNKENSLTDRFRALFTLRNLGGHNSIDWISKSFDDPSALLKHELAFCLGQMQDEYAIPALVRVLEDKSQEAMVRHEAGEALGAIGSPCVLETLKRYCKDPVIEVAETCELAVERIQWLQQHNEREGGLLKKNPYLSVDPTPPSTENDINKLRLILLDESKSLFDRYRAMFSLRNTQNSQAAFALAEGLKCSSALFRHEIAYVLGQMQCSEAIKALKDSLSDENENPMVRHECAEALGSIAEDECMKTLSEYLKDSEQVVSESCKVALDMYEYENSNQFQYANALSS